MAIEGVGDHLEGLGAFADGDDVTGDEQHGGDVGDLAVHEDVTVADELTGSGAGGGDAETEHDIVKSGFNQFDEVETSDTLLTGSAEEQFLELAFEDTVCIFRFLLLHKLQTILRLFGATFVLSVLSRRIVLSF